MTTLLKGTDIKGKPLSSINIPNKTLVEWCPNMIGLKSQELYRDTNGCMIIEGLKSIGSLDSFGQWLDTGVFPISILNENTDISTLCNFFGIDIYDIETFNTCSEPRRKSQPSQDKEESEYEDEEDKDDEKEYLDFQFKDSSDKEINDGYDSGLDCIF